MTSLQVEKCPYLNKMDLLRIKERYLSEITMKWRREKKKILKLKYNKKRKSMLNHKWSILIYFRKYRKKLLIMTGQIRKHKKESNVPKMSGSQIKRQQKQREEKCSKNYLSIKKIKTISSSIFKKPQKMKMKTKRRMRRRKTKQMMTMISASHQTKTKRQKKLKQKQKKSKLKSNDRKR